MNQNELGIGKLFIFDYLIFLPSSLKNCCKVSLPTCHDCINNIIHIYRTCKPRLGSTALLIRVVQGMIILFDFQVR